MGGFKWILAFKKEPRTIGIVFIPIKGEDVGAYGNPYLMIYDNPNRPGKNDSPNRPGKSTSEWVYSKRFDRMVDAKPSSKDLKKIIKYIFETKDFFEGL